MGLSVSVYKNIRRGDEDDYDFIAEVPLVEWEYKIKKLELGGLYKGDIDKNVDDLSYPYSTHNRFREVLIKLIDRGDLLDPYNEKIDWGLLKHERGISFYDLLYFSDCEGCLDWKISENLYQDFKKWEFTAGDKLDINDYGYYIKWLNIFDSARDKGVVVF